MHGYRGLIAAVVVIGLTGVAGVAVAADAPADKAAQDKALFDALKEMHNRAADLYNQGDANGCYRMFQGGLILAKTLLAHRPDVQKVVDDGMLEADRLASIPHRAVALHKTIEKVRERLKPPATIQTPPASPPNQPLPSSPGTNAPMPPASPATPPPMPPAKPPESSSGPSFPGATEASTAPVPMKSLWERLGGEKGVEPALDRFVGYILDSDPDRKVNMTRDGKYKFDEKARGEMKYKLLCYVSSISGGALVYTGKSMPEAHQGMNIKPSEFDEMLKWLRSAFELQKPPDPTAIDELVKKVQEKKGEIVEK
jgi:truncated hemoglobin YjbI